MSPSSGTDSNSSSDLEDPGASDSATAHPDTYSSALQDDVSTAQDDLMCPSGSPLSTAVQPAATMVGVSLVPLPLQPYQPMSYPKQVFGEFCPWQGRSSTHGYIIYQKIMQFFASIVQNLFN